MTPRTLGRYRVDSTLGRGAMGVVYRGQDETLHRPVALKVLVADALGDEAAQARFRDEALALSRLNHPNICTIYEVGEADGQTFLAMEYIEGQPLSAITSSHALPPDAGLSSPPVPRARRSHSEGRWGTPEERRACGRQLAT